jgi:hypothetical protein
MKSEAEKHAFAAHITDPLLVSGIGIHVEA